MSKAKPIPDGVPIVTPMLVCRDAAAEIDFCTTTSAQLRRCAGQAPTET